MINAEVLARTGASDVTGVARGVAGKQGNDGEKGGFSDALSSADKGSRKNEDAAAGNEAATPEITPDVVEDAPTAKGRSALDLTARVLLGKSAETGRASASIKDVLGETPNTATRDDAEDALAALVKPASSKAGTATSSKTDKTGDTEKQPEDQSAATDEAAAAKETGLDEMLSLLAGGAAVDAAANGTPRQGGQARERGDTRGEKTVGSATEGRAAQASAAAEASDALDMPTADGDASLVDERTFRLSSGRGTGQSLDMKIGTDEQGRMGFEAKAAGTGNAENVVVLDQRRFLGFGQSANGAALTAAMSDDKTWAAAMASGASLGDPLASSTGNVVNTLKLQLNPHDLGSVTATLRLSGETLNVHLTVENHAAHRQLSDDSSGMIEALRSQGFAVDQVTISVASSTQSDTSGQQQQQQSGQSSQQQQAAANDGRQGNAAGREQGQGNARTTTGESTRGTNEPVSDPVAAGNARPDQLYL